MSKEEVIAMIKRNKHSKHKAITFISDFLAIKRDKAKNIYEEEFENV